MALVGVVLIVAGVVLLLRAAAVLRADVVAKLVNVEFDPDGATGARPRAAGSIRQAVGLKSFEEELAALNDRMGRGREEK